MVVDRLELAGIGVADDLIEPAFFGFAQEVAEPHVVSGLDFRRQVFNIE